MRIAIVFEAIHILVALTLVEMCSLGVLYEQRVTPGLPGSREVRPFRTFLQTFNLEFAPISHYGERKCVASKCGERFTSASLGRR
jgi:hypothetical protein